MIGPSNLSGQTLGNYRLYEAIGTGGMAMVYRAEQLTIQRIVAIKVLANFLANDDEFVGRFRREAEIAARLEHPHIVPVHDFGAQSNILYVVMRYLSGGSLAQRMKRLGLPALTDATYLLNQICSALDYAHRHGIIHRDIKPANILLDEEGRAYLADFGIARLMNSAGPTVTTGIGTPAYMAPEQFTGQPVDARTDVYSLGVMLYVMVAGKLPFEADSQMGVGYQHVNTPPIPPIDINPALPIAVSDVVLKALAKTPPDRYQSAGAMAAALEQAIQADAAENDAENVVDTAYFVRPLPVTEAHDDGAGLGGHTPPSSKPRLPTWLQQPLPGVGPEGGSPVLLDTRPRTHPRRRLAVPLLVGGLVIMCLVGLAIVLSVSARILPNDRTPTSTIVAVAPTLTASSNTRPTPSAAPPPSATFTPIPLPSETPITTPPTLVPSPSVPTLPAGGGSIIQAGTTRTDAKNVAQVWVPDGCFMQGSDTAQDSAAQPDETPQHQVCFTRGFWIDQYEVTNEAFQAFVNDNGYKNQGLWSPEGWQWLQSHGITGPLIFLSGNNGPQFPRVGISWYEAEAYARWRGGRLPTEAEWEYTARGPDSRIYPWGNNFQTGAANVDEQSAGGQSLKQTSPVGSYQTGKSWVNAHDLVGNVWEWTLDWYDGNYYQRQVKTDPAGPANGTGRVLRGGSWSTTPQCARAACRRLNYRGRIPDLRDETVGFRIIVSDPGAGPASPTPTQVAVNGQCPGYLRTRMAIGRQGRVTPGDPNRLREEPNGRIIGRIPAEGVFEVIEGPSCGPEGMVWWRVNFEGQVGWTAEGKGAFYYLEPWPPTATPQPTAQ